MAHFSQGFWLLFILSMFKTTHSSVISKYITLQLHLVLNVLKKNQAYNFNEIRKIYLYSNIEFTSNKTGKISEKTNNRSNDLYILLLLMNDITTF